MDTKEAGKLGGLARAKRMTKAQRSAAASKAVTARGSKRRRYVTAQPRQKGGTR